MDMRDFRYCANPARTEFRWLHPADYAQNYADWTDVTELNDEEFEAFVTGKSEA